MAWSSTSSGVSARPTGALATPIRAAAAAAPATPTPKPHRRAWRAVRGLLLIRAPLLSGTPNLGTSIELTKLARADRVLVASHLRRKWRLNIADRRKSGRCD